MVYHPINKPRTNAWSSSKLSLRLSVDVRPEPEHNWRKRLRRQSPRTCQAQWPFPGTNELRPGFLLVFWRDDRGCFLGEPFSFFLGGGEGGQLWKFQAIGKMLWKRNPSQKKGVKIKHGLQQKLGVKIQPFKKRSPFFFRFWEGFQTSKP